MMTDKRNLPEWLKKSVESHPDEQLILALLTTGARSNEMQHWLDAPSRN